MLSPSEVTWTVLRRSTIRTSPPSLGPSNRAWDNGVRSSRSPPTISTGTDAGSGCAVSEVTGAE
jgi:hypothetical protein